MTMKMQNGYRKNCNRERLDAADSMTWSSIDWLRSVKRIETASSLTCSDVNWLLRVSVKERCDDAEDPDDDDSRYRIHGPPRTGDGPLHVHLSTRACPRVRKRHAHAHAFMLLLATHPDPLKEASR